MPSVAPVCAKHSVPKAVRSDGNGYRCLECKADIAKKRYDANREVILAEARERYASDPAYQKRKKLVARSHHLMTKFGITAEEYDALFVAQGGKCAICKKDQVDEKHGFGVDHDHKNGKIRGLLCKRCNLVLGNALDNPKVLRAAATYLELGKDGLTPQAIRTITQWSLDDYYTYIRPMSSAYVDRKRKPTIYWVVSVEFRNVEYQTWRGEGYDLSAVIEKMAPDIPRRSTVQPNYNPTGWLAPEQKAKKAKLNIVVERPRRRKAKR